jgi:hypothetical protein
MGKRSDRPRLPRDFYPTPQKAVEPLIPHLWDIEWYVEPCAGNGALVEAICNLEGPNFEWAGDLEPMKDGIEEHDAREGLPYLKYANAIITNPPHKKDVLFPLLDIWLESCKIVWLLLNADVAHKISFAKYMAKCEKVVSIGRVKWFPESNAASLENFAWYRFGHSGQPTQFVGRQKSA